jgi:hypothetical protein
MPGDRQVQRHAAWRLDHIWPRFFDGRRLSHPVVSQRAEKPSADQLRRFAGKRSIYGTNDITHDVDLANAPKRLAALVDSILKADSTLLLVLAQITATQSDPFNKLIKVYNAAMPQIVNERARAGKHILLVDMYAAFTANANFKTLYLHDTVHPNDAGYIVMGNVWYGAIKPFLH